MKIRLISALLAALACAAALPLAAQPTYGGRDPSAPWRAAAAARIEQLRKGDFTLRVVDAAGRPVPGATVVVEQQRHAFPFGTALQMARIFQDTSENRLYRQKTAALFNAASPENDLKWPPWIGEWGTGFNRTQTLFGLRWLRDRGYELRGHVFVWPGWTAPTTNLPNAITSLRGTPRQNEIPQLVLEHIAEQAAATREFINEWDVQNEPFDNKDLMETFGPQIQIDWFKAARAALPTAGLYLNDYNIEDQTRNTAHVRVFEDTVRYLQQNGAPITGLGLQGHFGANPSGIPDYLATLDRYAAFRLALRITEFDVNTTDLALQADYTRDFLTASFSHPAMAGFQFWGFWESAHWRPNAALYRADWSEKPNGAAYRALVFDQWWTRATGAANAQGEFRGRGFFGDYRATVTAGSRTFEKTFSLRAGAPAPTVNVTTEAPRLANLATRAQVGGIAGPLAAGFVIAGGVEKTVLLRGVGPALTAFGVPGALARPVLTLYRDGQPIATNTAWSSAANSAAIAAAAMEAGAFNLAPGSADSALLLRLASGAYSAQVTPADDGTGLALVEAYEVGAEAARFTNLSTRAFVGTGAAVAIPGLVVTGPTARTFLIRGIGPGLADFGVAGTLARPSLVLMHGSASVHANDRWETAPDPSAISAAGARTGAFALKPGNADAALLVTLEPGAYTVLISGANGGTGNCLVEIYEVN
ncbi:MAG: endo-1,4-beta-xylanase [Opitutaceae bacterium]|nr:endo-1,4-beta-xylanase [Opitutaceae bacterium]